MQLIYPVKNLIAYDQRQRAVNRSQVTFTGKLSAARSGAQTHISRKKDGDVELLHL